MIKRNTRPINKIRLPNTLRRRVLCLKWSPNGVYANRGLRAKNVPGQLSGAETSAQHRHINFVSRPMLHNYNCGN